MCRRLSITVSLEQRCKEIPTEETSVGIPTNIAAARAMSDGQCSGFEAKFERMATTICARAAIARTLPVFVIGCGRCCEPAAAWAGCGR